MLPLGERTNKFAPVTSPRIFLGYDSRSNHSTVIRFNSQTKRVSFRHQCDVLFNEHLDYSTYLQRKQSRFRTSAKQAVSLNRQRRYLSHDSVDEDDVHPMSPPPLPQTESPTECASSPQPQNDG